MDPHQHSQLFNVGGAKLSRLEDMRLITGNGKYSSDWNLPDQLHACFLRSDRAHARIVSINFDKVRQIKGVVGVYTGDDAQAAGYLRSANFLPPTGKGGMKARVPARPCLAIGKVRFVGDPVAMVIAESHLAAQDACELIEVVYEDLPAIVDPVEALKPGAPQLHDDVPGNCPVEAESGNEAATMEAIAKAAHVTKITVDCTRVTASPMEPRAALIEYKADGDSYIVHTPSQGVNMTRKQFATYSNLGEDKFRVEIQDVGGGFGQRSTVYPEYVTMMIAAKALNRPIKWVSTRTECFLTDTHGRANLITATLAMDKSLQFTGLRIDWITDQGAYLSPTGPAGHIRNATTCMNGVYKIPAMYGHFKVALTSTGWVAAYRGAGRPDIAYAIERAVDAAALELNMDPADLRRRNYVPLNEYPYKSATGSTIEIADLPGLSAKALTLADWSGFEARRAASAKKGMLRGIGMSAVIEPTGAGTYPRDEIELTVDASGLVTLHTVAHSQGQGHETSFAMVTANALGIATERIKVRQGDADRSITMVGNHSGGSRTMVGAGTVCHIAANKLIDAGKSLAAEDLGVEPSQVNYSKGEFSSPHSKKKITLAQLAAKKKLSVIGEGTFTSTYPNGCHIAEVEIDPDTGVTDIASYLSVDDCGHIVSHTIVEGQMHGAVVQGVGQVFGEHIVYDKDSGQMITGSFSDYIMPRAGQHLKSIQMEEYTTLSKLGPLGIKGMGESGCTASLPALVNAVCNALGIRHLDMPLTPSKVWAAIQQTKTQQAKH